MKLFKTCRFYLKFATMFAFKTIIYEYAILIIDDEFTSAFYCNIAIWNRGCHIITNIERNILYIIVLYARIIKNLVLNILSVTLI